MTDAELDRLEREATTYLDRTDQIGNLEPRWATMLHQARDVARDTLRVVDMVRAERSARRSIQEQHKAALARLAERIPV